MALKVPSPQQKNTTISLSLSLSLSLRLNEATSPSFSPNEPPSARPHLAESEWSRRDAGGAWAERRAFWPPRHRQINEPTRKNGRKAQTAPIRSVLVFLDAEGDSHARFQPTPAKVLSPRSFMYL